VSTGKRRITDDDDGDDDTADRSSNHACLQDTLAEKNRGTCGYASVSDVASGGPRSMDLSTPQRACINHMAVMHDVLLEGRCSVKVQSFSFTVQHILQSMAGVLEDTMESFFLSETAKYLFLLGANATGLPDFYVLTTEGHLLPPLPASAAAGAGVASGDGPHCNAFHSALSMTRS
jgi:Glycosyl hydrolase family 47